MKEINVARDWKKKAPEEARKLNISVDSDLSILLHESAKENCRPVSSEALYIIKSHFSDRKISQNQYEMRP